MSRIPEPTGSHIRFPDSSEEPGADASSPAADRMSSGQALAAVALDLAEHTVGVSVPADSSLAEHTAPGREAPSSSVRLTDGDLAEPRTAGAMVDIAEDMETAVGRVPTAAVEGAEAAASTREDTVDGLAVAAVAVSSRAVHQPSSILLTYEMMKQVNPDSLWARSATNQVCEDT